MFIAADLDHTVFAIPKFFQQFFKDLQGAGNKVGILTARPEGQKDENLKKLAEWDIKPDFYIGKPEQFEKVPTGIYKAVACNKLGIDVLFDDFENSDPEIIENYHKYNERTVPFTLSAISKQSVKNSNQEKGVKT